jgi:hypothetical protein
MTTEVGFNIQDMNDPKINAVFARHRQVGAFIVILYRIHKISCNDRIVKRSDGSDFFHKNHLKGEPNQN